MMLPFIMSFTIVDSVDIGDYANGVAFGNDYVWACDNGTDSIFKIDPDNMQIVSSFRYGGGLTGLAHDGEYLWIGYYPDSIRKIDTTGNTAGSWPSPGAANSYGMAFDGQYLWHTDADLRMIYKLDYNDPTNIIDSFAVSWTPLDLGWYRDHLWGIDYDSSLVYELDPTNMNIINSWSTGRPSSSGIALGGGYLWFSTNNSFGWVYKVEGIIGVEEDTTPIARSGFEILRVYPNPSRDRVNIQYGIVHGAKSIDIRIYDISGRLIKKFSQLTNNQSPVNQIMWQGIDNSGKKVPSGVYFLKFEAGDYKATKKLLLIR